MQIGGHGAVDVALISQDDRSAIEAHNAALHAAMAAVGAYEAAQRVPEPDAPHTQAVLDDEGEEIGTEPTPAYAAWTAAQLVITEATAEIKALARIRAGEPEEGDADLVAAEWGEAPEIAVPTPEHVARQQMRDLSPRQIRLVMLMIGLTDADVETQIGLISDEGERTSALIEWRYATSVRRLHPLVEMLRVQMAFDAGEFDALWRFGLDI